MEKSTVSSRRSNTITTTPKGDTTSIIAQHLSLIEMIPPACFCHPRTLSPNPTPALPLLLRQTSHYCACRPCVSRMDPESTSLIDIATLHSSFRRRCPSLLHIVPSALAPFVFVFVHSYIFLTYCFTGFRFSVVCPLLL